MTEPNKIYLTKTGTEQLSEGVVSYAYPSKNNATKSIYHSDTHLKDWIKENKSSDPFSAGYIIDVDELLKYLNEQ